MKTKSLSVIAATLALTLTACADRNHSAAPSAPPSNEKIGADGVTRYVEGGAITPTESVPVNVTEPGPLAVTTDPTSPLAQAEGGTGALAKTEELALLASSKELKLGPPKKDQTRKIKVVGDNLHCTSEFEARMPWLRNEFKGALLKTEKALAKYKKAVDDLPSRWSSGDTSKEYGELQVAYEGLTGIALEIKKTFGPPPWACDAGNGVIQSSDQIFPVYSDLRKRIGKARGGHTLLPEV